MAETEPRFRDPNEPSPPHDDRRDAATTPTRPAPADHDDAVDEASEESFPASDPPSTTPLRPGRPDPHDAR